MTTEYARTRERFAPHLNFRWSVADMDKIEELARKHRDAHQIAFELDATSVEIEDVCERNGIYLHRRMGVVR